MLTARRRKTSQERRLRDAAVQARRSAYAPYSRFAVGAAILTKSGRVFSACNVENGALGLSMCAEQAAVAAAVRAGETQFKEIAIVGKALSPLTPCGACRQVLAEFSPNMMVTMANMDGRQKRAPLSDLLPLRFKFLKRSKRRG
jgi:cytidine deaminase